MGNQASSQSESRTILVGEFAESDKKKNTNKIKTAKYTLATFLPKNMLEQFRRVANFYFLVVTIFAFMIESPVSPFTSLVPLIFVVAVTAVKQGYEDWLRHKSDNAVNNETVTVIRKNILNTIKCKEIEPGDLVKIVRNQDVPADMVLLVSSDSRAKSFVTTANLDGETNLKTIRVPAPLVGVSSDNLPNKMKIECQEPIPDLYTFHGFLELPDRMQTVSLNIDNLMLRGSRVKNTEWAIGCTVYAGEETKLALNSRFTQNKFTSCESSINKFLVIFIGVLLSEIIISFFLKRYFEMEFSEQEAYLGPSTSSNSFSSIMQDLLSFLLIYYYIIPISLYVTIELHKFFGSFYIKWDVDLQCEITNQQSVANSSDLNEELGQIEILFSDKTGTLTKNIMFFQLCSINGLIYNEQGGHLYDAEEGVEVDCINKIDIKLFLTILATCHSVQVEETITDGYKNGGLNDKLTTYNNNINIVSEVKLPRYQASSADEKALVEAAAIFGVKFLGDDNDKLKVMLNDNSVVTYERLQVLEFTSERRRMSVILRDDFGKIWLFCKGAESAVLPLCRDNLIVTQTDEHVQQFANKGLRTLTVAYKMVSEEEYESYSRQISMLRMNRVGRPSDVAQTDFYRKMETELTLLGATAVEDQLQDEVAETLISLREAGIQIWVLTGDKTETAISVAQSCGHIKPSTHKLFLSDVKTKESMTALLAEYLVATKAAGHFTLVVDGQSVAFALGNVDEETFCQLSLRCEAVICCRLSPLQKSQIVALIKRSPSKPITAAIGDGANDISMIQEADVGFGIFGREGRQAARSADFAIPNFSMLRKLLIVHGHWYYQRLATLVQYFFYKNLLFMNLMVFFQIQSLFSTQSIFDSLYLTLFNLAFTSLPCLVLSLTEQCHSKEQLLGTPELYKKHRRNKLLSWPYFLGWCAVSVTHSVTIYVCLFALWHDPVINMDGKSTGMWCYGAALYHCVIVVVNLKLWMCAKHQTWPLIAGVFISIVGWIAIASIYSSIFIILDGDVLGTYIRLVRAPTFWFATIIITVAALLPDWLLKCTKALLNPPPKRQSKIEITEL